MGLGGEFWEIVRQQAEEDRTVEGLCSLRGKKLAVDLSYWICQLDGTRLGGLRGHGRGADLHNKLKPHLRNLFFRVVKLVARVGALPIFVVDGEPPPQKFCARMERFCRLQGIPFDPSMAELPAGRSAPRNSAFVRMVEDCAELLRLLGMPVLRAPGEAEALCGLLNRGGWADFCVTPDSDIFLHGATHVIKRLQVDYKDPLVERYSAEAIAAQTGLHQAHLVALALLLGCDYRAGGVRGVGRARAVRLVRAFHQDEILDRLRAWGRGELPSTAEMDGSDGSSGEGASDSDAEDSPVSTLPSSDGRPPSHGRRKRARSPAGEVLMKRPRHCGDCGHPGLRREHEREGCRECGTRAAGAGEKSTRGGGGGTDRRADIGSALIGCVAKEKGFRCSCQWCLREKKATARKRRRTWWGKVCRKMAATEDFPDEAVIKCYLHSDVASWSGREAPEKLLQWQPPQLDHLELFLECHLSFEATYVRQKVLPLLSHGCLKRMAAAGGLRSRPLDPAWLINGQYAPTSIKRAKRDCGEMLFVLSWEKPGGCLREGSRANRNREEEEEEEEEREDDWLGLGSSKRKQRGKGRGKGGVKEAAAEWEEDPLGAADGRGEAGGKEGRQRGFTTDENQNLVKAACPRLWAEFEKIQAAKAAAKVEKGTRRKGGKGAQDDRASQPSLLSFFQAKKSGQCSSESRPSMDPCPQSMASDASPSIQSQAPLGQTSSDQNAVQPGKIQMAAKMATATSASKKGSRKRNGPKAGDGGRGPPGVQTKQGIIQNLWQKHWSKAGLASQDTASIADLTLEARSSAGASETEVLGRSRSVLDHLEGEDREAMRHPSEPLSAFQKACPLDQSGGGKRAAGSPGRAGTVWEDYFQAEEDQEEGPMGRTAGAELSDLSPAAAAMMKGSPSLRAQGGIQEVAGASDMWQQAKGTGGQCPGWKKGVRRKLDMDGIQLIDLTQDEV